MKAKPSLREVMNTEKNLAEIANEARELERLVMDAGGEITPELESRLNFNLQQLQQKVDSYVHVEEHFDAMEAIWKRKADACAAIAKRFARTRDQLRDRVKFVMGEMQTNEIRGKLYRYKLSSSPGRLVIDSEAALPDSFKMIVTTTVPDKERIKEALKAGFEIPGAHFEGGTTLRTYEVADKE
jgi:hypothetical protein